MNVRKVLLGLFVALTIFFASTTLYESTLRTTAPSITTTTVTSTSTVVAINRTSVRTTIALHKVVFNESTLCDNQYADRWAVTLGGVTIVQPSNATFPFSGATSFGPVGEAISKITFTVPGGTYDWNVSARTGLGPESGTVSVNDTDVVVQMLAQPPGFCGGGQG